MNGAITEPWVKTIKVPIKTIVIIKGASQYFFLTLRNPQISFKSSIKSFIFNKFWLNQI